MSVRSLLRTMASIGLMTAPALPAQVITLRAGDGLRVQVAPSQKVGIPIALDLSAGGGTSVASITTGVHWGSTRLVFDSIRGGGFGSLTANTSGAGSGSLDASVFDPSGTANSVTLATVWFTASATTGGTRLTLTPRAAGDADGADILHLLRVLNVDVCVATAGVWGDVTGDAAVNIIDAQQIARHSVGLSVQNASLVAGQGDVNADGVVNIIDAQQIARFSVGLSASARVNTATFAVPAAASVILDQADPSIPVTGEVILAATPKDESSASLAGCVPVTWESSQPSVATVDSTGRVVGVATGTATITATAGGKTVQTTVTVGPTAGAPASVQVVDGNGQWSYWNIAAPVLPRVRVFDGNEVPVPNAEVTFTVTGGSYNGGQPRVALTDAEGYATAVGTWITPVLASSVAMNAAVAGTSGATITVNLTQNASGTATCVGSDWGVRCWGAGARGQLGNGGNDASSTPVAVSNTSPPLTGGITLTASGDHFCGLTAAGAAWCWGANSGGQLGDGTRTDRNVPTAVTGGLSFVSIATGVQHTCAVTDGGDVYCWGMNPYGQLGDSTRGTSYTAPTRAATPAGVAFLRVAAGANHTCAATAAGDVYCWGLNGAGQLGSGTFGGARPWPAPVAGAAKFPGTGGSPHSIAANFSTTCALTAAGAAYCWGLNSDGQLGTGSAGTPSAVPLPVIGGHAFDAISVAPHRACGRTPDPQAVTLCWGFNNGGIGDGSTATRLPPTVMPFTLHRLFHGGFAGVATSCGLGLGGQQVYCWGVNAAGQVGDGTTTLRMLPTLIPRAGADAGVAVAMEAASLTLTPQSAAKGTAVADVPAVIVRDGFGAPVSGVTVTWEVLSGGGATVHESSVTSAGGIASSGGWTLGTGLGMQTLQAVVSGIVVNGNTTALRVTFVAFATNDPAAIVAVSPGDSVYLAGPNIAVTVPHVVRVTDGAGDPVSNMAVRFEYLAFTGSATATMFTDASGIAALPAFLPITQTAAVVARVPGLDSVLFSVVVLPGVANIFGLTSCELAGGGTIHCSGRNVEGAVGDGTNDNRDSFVAVAGGHTFTALAEGTGPSKCALSGTAAYCWGSNAMGQLGDGTQTNRNTPTLVTGGHAFVQIYSQNFTTCGLTTSGQLYCWGWSGTAGWGLGESGRMRVFREPTLVNTGGLTFTQIAVTDDGVCGLTAAGTIHCLGRGDRGFNGDGTTAQRTTFSQWHGGPWKSLNAGNLNVCAITVTDRVFCLGLNGNSGGANGTPDIVGNTVVSAPVPIASTLAFASVHVGNMRACARTLTGSEVYCWGLHSGTGPDVVTFPVRIAGEYASVRQTTFRNACAVGTNGLLHCWGSNGGSGAIGDGTTLDRLTPTAVMGWPAGPGAATPVTVAGTTATFPVGTIGEPLLPKPAVIVRDRFGTPLQGVTVTFAAEPGHGVVTGATQVTDVDGLATVGDWTLPGLPGSATLSATVTGLTPALFRANVQVPAASISAGALTQTYAPEFFQFSGPLSVTVRDSANNPLSSRAVTWSVEPGNGAVSGQTSVNQSTNAQGISQLFNWMPPDSIGTFTINASVAALPPVSLTFTRVPWHALEAAVCQVNDGVAECWGGNNYGQIGDGTTTERLQPTVVSGSHVFTSMAKGANGAHQCAIDQAGAAWCWGNNSVGQLGNGTFTNSSAPVAVAGGHAFTALATSPYATCGITTSGALYCWGWSGWSHRADGEIYTARTTPTKVNTGAHTFTQVSMGLRSICGLKADGQVFCWGENGAGQLGLGNMANQLTPHAVNTVLRFSQLTSGMDHHCGITTAGTVACWGENVVGQVGNGTTTHQLVPTTIGLTNVTDIRAGERHTCARLDDNTLRCWGANGSGQLGDGTTDNRHSPVTIGASIGATALSAFGRFVSCARTTDGTYCWGITTANAGVGDGTPGVKTQPTAVVWP